MIFQDVFAQIAGSLFAFIAVYMLVPPLCKLAIDKGFVDQPGGRKIHDTLTPPIGGIILFPVYMLVSVFTGVASWPLLAALSLVLVTGAVDDYKHISPWIKFGVQFVAAAVIVLPGGAQLEHLGNVFGLGTLWLGFMAVPFSIISVVLFINAINLMDGLDGLAGGISFIALGWLVVACLVAGVTSGALAITPLMGALAGFLAHNMRSALNKKAKLFLGDAGSMGLGLVLAWFCIHLVKGPIAVMPPISIAWIIALPIIDVCAQFYRRARAGRHPFSPDRGHFHHHFIDAGYPVGRATAFILLISFVLGGIGYLGPLVGVPQLVLTGVWIVLILSHMAVSQKPARYIKLLAAKQ